MTNDAARSSLPSLDPFRTGRAYTISQAARLAKTTDATVRRWLRGYDRPGHHMGAVFGGHRATQDDEGPVMVSFLDLIEIAVVARFRRVTTRGRTVSLDRLRDAHRYARNELGLSHPFATLDLFEFGGHVLHEFTVREPGPGVLALDMGGQWSLPDVVQAEERNLDFEPHDRYAVRWFPKGRTVPIVVDPRVSGGRLTVYQTGVTLDTITKRFQKGESMVGIAEDYEIDVPIVEEAIRESLPNAA